MGVPSLQVIFDEKYYLNLEGGILEALGRMFKSGLKLFVYPVEDEKTGELLTATQFEVAPNLHHLYQYLIENGFIQEITNFNREYLKIFPPDVLAKMRAGDSTWERMVPPEVSRIIKGRQFFGYRPSATDRVTPKRASTISKTRRVRHGFRFIKRKTMAKSSNSVIGIDLGKHVFKSVLLQRKGDDRLS